VLLLISPQCGWSLDSPFKDQHLVETTGILLKFFCRFIRRVACRTVRGVGSWTVRVADKYDIAGRAVEKECDVSSVVRRLRR